MMITSTHLHTWVKRDYVKQSFLSEVINTLCSQGDATREKLIEFEVIHILIKMALLPFLAFF